MASSMGKKHLEKKATSANVEVPSKSIEKLAIKVTKKKRRFRGKKKSSSDQPTDQLKKALANFKPPKDSISNNWQAFLASGLPHSDKRNKKKTSELKPGSHASESCKSNQNIAVLRKREKVKSFPTTETKPLVLVDETDDAYISELIPKSDGERELTKCIAIDCEMVGVDDGRDSVLARVSLVNQHGECLYDRFVKPKEKVVDYRTHVSGVRPSDLKRGEEFDTVQKDVANIIKGRILVGHAIRNDLKVLMISHPAKMIRDTSRFKPFRNLNQGRTPGLKKLASEILGVNIQSGEHSSVEDAKATMQLYNLYQKEWEGYRQQKRELRKKNAKIAEKLTKPLPKKKEAADSSKLPDEFVAF
ncbi:RNA exonuclease 4 [Thrips palmi]|uniref:RNA exonuclease 4 n=1 Tax=Thrips palmi TaxID=161013 RepID=A0A6P8YG81_THRPL|nr:RNA exonuclease 4 [Thrips palmi]